MSISRAIGVLSAALALCWATGLRAQDYQSTAPRPVPSVRPEPRVPEPPPTPRPAGNQTILPMLKGLVFVDGIAGVRRDGIAASGIDATTLAPLQDGEFRTAMAAFVGQPLTLDRLNEITAAVVAQYRRADRPLVDVIVPEQDINNGVVQIAVVEFRIGAVRAEGNRWFAGDMLVDRLRAKPGDVIIGSELLTDVEALNDNPFRQVDLVYERSPLAGRTDVVLRTQDRLPLRVYAGYDDAGSPSVGPNRVLAGFNWGNVFGLDHQFGYQFTASDDLLFGNPAIPGRPDKPRFLAHSANYTVPLPGRDKLTLFGLYAESVPRLANTLQQVGTSAQASLRYTIALAGSERFRHELRFGYDYKQSNNNLEFGGSQVSRGRSDIDQGLIEYGATWRDAYGSTSGVASLYVSPGGLTADNTDAAFRAGAGSRPQATANYVYGQIGAERQTVLPKEASWSARGLLQRSSAPLLPSEQLGLGGPTTLRGYDPYAVLGDQGWLLVNEVRLPAVAVAPYLGLSAPGDRLQLLAFLDIGHVASLAPQANQPPTATLASTGVGFRYALDRYLDITFDYGWPLRRLAGNPVASRGHFSIVLAY